MRGRWLAIWVGVLGCGCGDDAACPVDAGERDAGVRHDADRRRDAASDGGDAELEALVAAAVAEFDHSVDARCPCFVENGSYASNDECVELNASGPSWISCLTNALSTLDTPENRAGARCYIAQGKARNACLADTACGTKERNACEEIALSCAKLDPAIAVFVSEECPDTTILPRLAGGGAQ